MASFKNTHQSFSRLSRFEQCPMAFKLHYVDKQRAEPGIPLRFGKAVHAALEVLVREHIDDERSGPLSEDRAAELWQNAWAAEDLSRLDLFQEGLDIVRAFVRDQGVLDHQDVLAIEHEFRLPVGPFTVLGFIDRVDRLDDDGVEVIDYKSNRILFTRDEVDTSLQLGLYALAAKQLSPWAKRIRLTFHMLRHGIRQSTERTQEQLDAVVRYVETLGRQTEEATEYPARLNSNCVWCDHRHQCPAYADALKGKRDFICEDMDDLEAVAREREEVARLAKALYARKSELDGVLKTHLQEHDELVLAGTRYRLYNVTSLSYPLEPTLRILGQATGVERDELLSRLAAVDKKALDRLVRKGRPGASPGSAAQGRAGERRREVALVSAVGEGCAMTVERFAGYQAHDACDLFPPMGETGTPVSADLRQRGSSAAPRPMVEDGGRPWQLAGVPADLQEGGEAVARTHEEPPRGFHRPAPAGDSGSRKAGRTLAFVDVDTTGLDPARHELIEVAVIRVDASTLDTLDEVECRVRPRRLAEADSRALDLVHRGLLVGDVVRRRRSR